MSYFEPEEPVEAVETTDSTPETDQAVDATPSEPVEGAPEVDAATPEAAGQEAATDGAYDLDGVAFNGLSKEQVEALTRGTSLNKDYTQGKQKLGDDVRTFNRAVRSAQTNPMELRKYFTPEHLIRALGYDPSQTSRAPGTAHTTNTGAVDYTKFEPEAAAVFKNQQTAIDQLTKANGQLQERLGGYDERFNSADNDKNQATLETEVQGAMGKFPILNQDSYKDYNRQLILMKIAANPERSAMDIANEVSKVWASGKTPVDGPAPRKRVVGPGGSVPLKPSMPKTFAEGSRAASARFGVTHRE